MAYRSEALDVLPEIESFANEVLTEEKVNKAGLVAKRLLGTRQERKWAIAKSVLKSRFAPISAFDVLASGDAGSAQKHS